MDSKWAGGVVAAVALLLGAGLAGTLSQAQGADGVADARAERACNGVRLVGAPYIAIGLGPLVLEITQPLDDLITCQPVELPRPGARQACDNAQVPGHKLRRKLAAEATRCLIDNIRSNRGLSSLDPHDRLRKAAKRHTERMISAGCFAHTCGGEPDLVARVTNAGYLPCNCSWNVGENIAWGSGRNGSPSAIVDAWMNSPPHRAMILSGNLEDVDVGVRPGKPGSKRAGAATYTADFGRKD